MRCSCRLFRRDTRARSRGFTRQSTRAEQSERRTGSTGAGIGCVSSGEWCLVGGEKSAGLSAKRTPASQPAHFRRARRDFESKWKGSDARSQSATPRSSITHTHSPHHPAVCLSCSHVFLFTPSLPLLLLALPLLSLHALSLDSFAHRPSHAPGPHRHPCAVRAISAASGHSNKQHGLRVSAFPSPPLVSAERVSERALPPSTPICLPARSCAAAAPPAVDVHHHCRPQWTRGRHAELNSLPQACTARLPSASLPWLCWIAPAARERTHSHHRIPTGTPALPLISCTKTVAWLARPGSDSSPPPRRSHLAQALISPTCRLRVLLAFSSIAACDLLDLAASATVSAPSPCNAANNNTTASHQHFACGRPIHLATSSPNERAEFPSSLAQLPIRPFAPFFTPQNRASAAATSLDTTFCH